MQFSLLGSSVKGEAGSIDDSASPVVIWTAREEDIERAYRSGASVYLTKAFLAAIEDLMALRSFFERVQFPVWQQDELQG